LPCAGSLLFFRSGKFMSVDLIDTHHETRCSYCDAPMRHFEPRSGPGPGSKQAAYCCYGCRLLGESGRRPLPLVSEAASSWFKIAIGALVAGQAMLLGLAINLDPPAGMTRWLLHGALITSSGLVVVLLGKPLALSVRDSFQRRQLTIELLFGAGILGAFGASLVATITGQGSVYYEVVAVLLTVYAASKTLGAQSRARALAESQRLRAAFDQCMAERADGTFESVRVAEIVPGRRVLVRPGEPIPIDGKIVVGEAFVRETPLTGEPFAVVRRTGHAVQAGSYSEDGRLVIEATVSGDRRGLDRLLAMLDQARSQPSQWESQADQIVRWFLPLVFVVALGTFGFWSWRAGFAQGLFNSLAVVLVACPCAMGLATPMALWNALAVLAARGLVVRNPNLLAELSTVDQVVCDKTGTLSEDTHSLIDLAVIASIYERARILELLQAVQAHSPHPISRAFLEGFASASEPSMHVVFARAQERFDVISAKTVPAHGLEAWVRNADGPELHVKIGTRSFMDDLGSECALLNNLRHGTADQLIYVQIDRRLTAIASLRERLRATADDMLRQLNSLKINACVLTGDQAQRSRELGLPHVEGALTPEDKAARIQAMRKNGARVLFVGDGVNDAPAIHAAQAGIGMAHGAGITTAHADAILFGGDLLVLPWAIAIARQVQHAIRSNLIFAAAYNAVGMILAASGVLHPVAAALLMVISSFTVSWRALRSSETTASCPHEIPANTLAVPLPPTTAGLPGSTWTSSASSSPAFASPRQPDQSLPASASETSWRRLLMNSLLHAPNTAAVLMISQVPFLIYLGRLELIPSMVLSFGYLASAYGLIKYRPQGRDAQHWASMTLSMLGLGNWGMILGWWADLGFQPWSAQAAAACCSSGAAWYACWQMPGMNAGMLLLALPSMVTQPSNRQRGLSAWAVGLLASIGMLWGMNYGHQVLSGWLAPEESNQFLVALAGMTGGMLLGMFLCCELGRALILWRNANQTVRS
jgi:P-type Cu+ transporter